MAGELLAKNASGTTVTAQIWLGALVANTVSHALEAYSDGNWALYAVPLTEQGTSGTYVGDFPAWLTTAGRYSLMAYEVADATPTGDTLIAGPAPFDWTGTAQFTPQSGVSPPGVVKIYGYEFDGQIAIEDRSVSRTLLNAPQVSGSAILETQTITKGTDSTGYWFHWVIPGKQYRIMIAEAGVDKTITAPSVDTNLATLLP
jgi:hypothetical protein